MSVEPKICLKVDWTILYTLETNHAESHRASFWDVNEIAIDGCFRFSHWEFLSPLLLSSELCLLSISFKEWNLIRKTHCPYGPAACRWPFDENWSLGVFEKAKWSHSFDPRSSDKEKQLERKISLGWEVHFDVPLFWTADVFILSPLTPCTSSERFFIIIWQCKWSSHWCFE